MIISPLSLVVLLHRIQGGVEVGSAASSLAFAQHINFVANKALTLQGLEFLTHISVGALDEAARLLGGAWPPFQKFLEELEARGKIRLWKDTFNFEDIGITQDDMRDRLMMYVLQLGQGWISDEMTYEITFGGRRPTAVDFAAELFNVLNGRELAVGPLFHSMAVSQRISFWALHHAFLKAWNVTGLSTLIDLYPSPKDFELTFGFEPIIGIPRGLPKLIRVPTNVVVLGRVPHSIVAPK